MLNKKQTFKKITLIIILAFFLLAPSFSGVHAEKASLKLTAVGQAAGFGNSTLPSVIGGIIKGFLSLLGVLFLSYTIYAGYLWLTASGDEEKIKKSKKIITASIIGLVITLGAYAITSFVITRFTTVGVYESGPAQTTPTDANGCQEGEVLINNECTFIGGDPSQ